MENPPATPFDTMLMLDNKTLVDQLLILTDPIDLLTLETFHKVMIVFWFLICGTGICTNSLNLRTFLAMGLSDSVTVSFFTLAISDLGICSIALAEMMIFVTHYLEKDYNLYFYLPSSVVIVYFFCARKLFNTTTILITTFLAVQRCLCVVLPFHVKGMFTKFRTLCFLAVIFTFSTICTVLYVWKHELIEVPNSVHNSTQLKLFYPPGSEPYLFIMETLNGTVLNLGCQATVLLCLIVIGVTLRKSVQFRRSATTQVTDNNKITATNVDAAKTKERTKETQALVQVSLVSAIFIVSYCPYIGYGIANIFLPEFGLNLAYFNLFHLVHNIMFTTELFNSSVNVFVYYKFNTKFRDCFAFCRK